MYLLYILNLAGHTNCIIGSKVMAFFLNWWRFSYSPFYPACLERGPRKIMTQVKLFSEKSTHMALAQEDPLSFCAEVTSTKTKPLLRTQIICAPTLIDLIILTSHFTGFSFLRTVRVYDTICNELYKHNFLFHWIFQISSS